VIIKIPNAAIEAAAAEIRNFHFADTVTRPAARKALEAALPFIIVVYRERLFSAWYTDEYGIKHADAESNKTIDQLADAVFGELLDSAKADPK
jgi:hypothetical protein